MTEAKQPKPAAKRPRKMAREPQPAEAAEKLLKALREEAKVI